MRTVSNKSCTENLNTHFMFSNFFFPENRTIYEILSKNVVQTGAADSNMAARCMLD
jgi:hypothetical protein